MHPKHQILPYANGETYLRSSCDDNLTCWPRVQTSECSLCDESAFDSQGKMGNLNF